MAGNLQDEVLRSVSIVEQEEACALLGMPDTENFAALQRLEVENRILRVDWEGKAVYPLFQFNVAERQVYPSLIMLMKMRADDWGGKIALLHWLTLPNRNLGGARPCDRLHEDADAIVNSFYAEIHRNPSWMTFQPDTVFDVGTLSVGTTNNFLAKKFARNPRKIIRA